MVWTTEWHPSLINGTIGPPARSSSICVCAYKSPSPQRSQIQSSLKGNLNRSQEQKQLSSRRARQPVPDEYSQCMQDSKDADDANPQKKEPTHLGPLNLLRVQSCQGGSIHVAWVRTHCIHRKEKQHSKIRVCSMHWCPNSPWVPPPKTIAGWWTAHAPPTPQVRVCSLPVGATCN